MNRTILRIWGLTAVFAAVLLCGFASEIHSEIIGMDPTAGPGGPVFDLTARCDFITTPDGNSILIWGYSPGLPADGSRAQYPGPTLIVNEGDLVTINLYNQITDETGHLLNGLDGRPRVDVSMVFPGINELDVTDAAWIGSPGILTREAVSGDQVRYMLQANNPGTYMYYSGTDPQLQLEMGLFGTIVVRPALGLNHAYNHGDAGFDVEFLFLLSEMDPEVHDLVEFGLMDQIDNTEYFPVYWFINGRAAPDTLAPANAQWLPTQPYNALTLAHPGQKVLLRVVGASRDIHPFHTHGNHVRVIAKDGKLLTSGTPDPAGPGADLSFEIFTIPSTPGETVDAIFQWTGKQMGWDIYGDPADPAFAHNCTDTNTDGYDDATYEWCDDHGKPFPVVLPEKADLTFGGFWSGSPYMGAAKGLPPGEGGLNPSSGFFFMWHSHTEKELVNFDIFPGGMLTMMLVDPWP